jgi:hypothetical protein
MMYISRFGYSLWNRHVLVDLPGQVEVLTWHACGAMLVLLLRSFLSVICLYCVDSICLANYLSNSFNVLQASYLRCKLNLPTLLLYNKNDIFTSSISSLSRSLQDGAIFNSTLRVRRHVFSYYFSRSVLLSLQAIRLKIMALNIQLKALISYSHLFSRLSTLRNQTKKGQKKNIDLDVNQHTTPLDTSP